MKIKSVIIAGGEGKRLWPISYKGRPKQFIKIAGNRSPFQHTILRNKYLGPPLIIANLAHLEIVKQQLKEIKADADIIAEPIGRNTAICAITAAIYAKQKNYDCVALFPSDHHIVNLNYYRKTISTAINNLLKSDIVIIGIRPTLPLTGYGYVKIDKKIDKEVYLTKEFVEKPTAKMAQKYMLQPNYLWNSGMFFFKADFMLKKAKQYLPDSLSIAYKAFKNSKIFEECIVFDKNIYINLTPISLDYAIIEHIKSLILVKAKFFWSDLGSWESLWNLNDKDVNKNYLEGNIITNEVTNSYIKTNDHKTTVVIGLDNIVVVDYKDKLLVANRSKSELLGCLDKIITT